MQMHANPGGAHQRDRARAFLENRMQQEKADGEVGEKVHPFDGSFALIAHATERNEKVRARFLIDPRC